MGSNDTSNALHSALEFLEAKQYVSALICIGKLEQSEKSVLIKTAYSQTLQDENLKAFCDIYFFLQGEKIPPSADKAKKMAGKIIVKWNTEGVTSITPATLRYFYELLVHCTFFKDLFSLRAALMKNPEFKQGYEVSDELILAMKAYASQKENDTELTLDLYDQFKI